MTTARAAALAALVVSVALGVTAWRARTGAVGGSDSACYALMTQAYAAGERQPVSALAVAAPWPDATRVAAPGGFLPSPPRPGAAVPVCAPGYSLLLAPLAVVAGRESIHVVPPLAAALLAWAAFLLGRRLASPWAGLGAALLVAAHPIVLFQAVQPMNDITTAALWVGVCVAALGGRAVVTGLLIGLGLLVRPNLAPAAVAAVLVCGAVRAGGVGRAAWPRAIRTMALATLAAAPGVVAVLWLNASLYGSPARSGYGDLDQLFALAHVPVNLARYGRTWLVTSTPIVLAALAAPWLVSPSSRPRVWGLLAIAGALSVVYLAYRPFPEWWYLRFLLPAVTVSLVLAAVALVSLGQRVAGAAGVGAALLACVAASVWTARSAEAAEAFGLQRLESRFTTTADAVAVRLPSTAAIVTGWQSGPIRFGPGQEILMWDALDPAWLDRALAWLDQQGRAPALVLETWEEAPFRARFAGQQFGALDWPPRYDVERRVHIYLPADRARFLRGEAVAVEPVFTRPRGTR